MGDSIKFWKDLCTHPNCDSFWYARNARNFVQYIPKSCATLIVGGLFDAEDCYGAWNLYRAIEQKAHNDNRLVIGPWAHGYWARDSGYALGNICFGSATSVYYQQHFEVPFFNYYLKGKGNIDSIKECNVFSTGDNTWNTYPKWADTTLAGPQHIKNTPLYLEASGKLTYQHPQGFGSFDYYLSDPGKPIPYTQDIHFARTREYMTDDQRFAARRPDVLVYQTDTLTSDIKIAGPVIADLFTSISTTDADFIVKIIDVFPDDFRYTDENYDNKTYKYPMGGYQMLIRADVMRGRYRNSLQKPEPFTPEEITEVKYTLPDISHVFKKGHRVMVQVQSSWFPLVDRNPQKFVNIYTAKPEDFVRSTITIHHDREHPSQITLPIVKE
jgi:putative CocE/NonD family hydrolase